MAAWWRTDGWCEAEAIGDQVKPPQARMGRPPVPIGGAKSTLLSVRFTAGEREALDAAAAREGLQLSEWSRRKLLAAAGLEPARSPDPVLPESKNASAVALGRLGGMKGGKARAEKLSPERRKQIAREAAAKRWGTKPGAPGHQAVEPEAPPEPAREHHATEKKTRSPPLEYPHIGRRIESVSRPVTDAEIAKFTRAAHWIARKYRGKFAGLVDYEDLVAECTIAAWVGVGSFDPDQGASMMTWVVRHMHQNMARLVQHFGSHAGGRASKGLRWSATRPERRSIPRMLVSTSRCFAALRSS
jgi:hypothetical protein